MRNTKLSLFILAPLTALTLIGCDNDKKNPIAAAANEMDPKTHKANECPQFEPGTYTNVRDGKANTASLDRDSDNNWVLEFDKENLDPSMFAYLQEVIVSGVSTPRQLDNKSGQVTYNATCSGGDIYIDIEQGSPVSQAQLVLDATDRKGNNGNVTQFELRRISPDTASFTYDYDPSVLEKVGDVIKETVAPESDQQQQSPTSPQQQQQQQQPAPAAPAPAH